MLMVLSQQVMVLSWVSLVGVETCKSELHPTTQALSEKDVNWGSG